MAELAGIQWPDRRERHLEPPELGHSGHCGQSASGRMHTPALLWARLLWMAVVTYGAADVCNPGSSSANCCVHHAMCRCVQPRCPAAAARRRSTWSWFALSVTCSSRMGRGRRLATVGQPLNFKALPYGRVVNWLCGADVRPRLVWPLRVSPISTTDADCGAVHEPLEAVEQLIRRSR